MSDQDSLDESEISVGREPTPPNVSVASMFSTTNSGAQSQNASSSLNAFSSGSNNAFGLLLSHGSINDYSNILTG